MSDTTMLVSKEAAASSSQGGISAGATDPRRSAFVIGATGLEAQSFARIVPGPTDAIYKHQRWSPPAPVKFSQGRASSRPGIMAGSSQTVTCTPGIPPCLDSPSACSRL